MNLALSKMNKLIVALMINFIFALLLSLPTQLSSQEMNHSKETSFTAYLSKRLQQKRFDDALYKKIWNYLSNPAKGYQYAGIKVEELSE